MEAFFGADHMKEFGCSMPIYADNGDFAGYEGETSKLEMTNAMQLYGLPSMGGHGTDTTNVGTTQYVFPNHECTQFMGTLVKRPTDVCLAVRDIAFRRESDRFWLTPHGFQGASVYWGATDYVHRFTAYFYLQ